MSIENTTLVHFRHFSSLLNNEIRSTNSYVRNYKPFLTNKANFRKSQMNVSDLLIREYEQMDTWSSGKNKANTNPIQTQYKANTKPKQTQNKPKQSQFLSAISVAGWSRKNPIWWGFTENLFSPKNEPSGPILRLKG